MFAAQTEEAKLLLNKPLSQEYIIWMEAAIRKHNKRGMLCERGAQMASFWSQIPFYIGQTKRTLYCNQ